MTALFVVLWLVLHPAVFAVLGWRLAYDAWRWGCRQWESIDADYHARNG